MQNLYLPYFLNINIIVYTNAQKIWKLEAINLKLLIGQIKFSWHKKRFNVDIMMLYISAMDHARKLKFSSYVHLAAIYKQNASIWLRLNDSVQCRRGYYFWAWVLYFSFGTY